MQEEILVEKVEYPFEFSVVMAVYNVEPFLREAVDSLIKQDFGFEKIQLIMVDDGSTDGSGAICDEYAEKYPENVVVIHKENGGVASARNEGLKYAVGRYLNFMDSDDRFTRNAFREVHRFFRGREDEIDIVTIPLEFFDAQRGAHWQNYKFKKGSRILDLYWDYQATLMFVNASFFVNEVKSEIVFDPHLVCGEDIKVLLTILAYKMKYGVVSRCKYMYRRRSAGEASLIQAAKKKYGWYFDYFTYLVDWAVEFYQERFGYLPGFLQYELLADLQWRFKENYDMSEVLTEKEIELYKQRLFQSLRYFDDKYILEQKMIWNEHKCYMLSKKYGCPPTLTNRFSNVIVHFGETRINSMADQLSRIEFLRIEDNRIFVEGYVKVFGVDLEEPVEVCLQVNGALTPCEVVQRDSLNEFRFDELIFRGVAFRAEVLLDEECEKYKVGLILLCRGATIYRRDIRCGSFFPIGKKYKNAYYYSNGWVAQFKGAALHISWCGRKGRLHHEWAFLKELWKKNALGSRKAVCARIAYHVLKRFKRRPIWLISDRIVKADDNGEAFFRFMQSQHKKDVNSYFVLSKDSGDFARLRSVGKTVDALSFRHKLLHLLCDCNISSHADDITVIPFKGYHDSYRDILADVRFVFLQHGVTKDDVSGWLNRFNRNMSGFVTAAIPEYDSITEGAYFYTPEEVWLTGLPRFDRLYQDECRCITIVPTWREYLMAGQNPNDGIWRLSSDFFNSSFFRFYNALLSDARLLEAAGRYGYQIQFMPHPTLQPHLSVFEQNEAVRYLGIDTSYRDIYAQSSLMITDYSSAVFDFAYLRKPLLYCQFDAEEFFKGEHVYTKGYFDYERDGFGEVEYDLESTVDRIIEYMENGCRLKDKYRERIDGFFAFDDQNNCQRVYEKIITLQSWQGCTS